MSGVRGQIIGTKTMNTMSGWTLPGWRGGFWECVDVERCSLLSTLRDHRRSLLNVSLPYGVAFDNQQIRPTAKVAVTEELRLLAPRQEIKVSGYKKGRWPSGASKE